MHVSLDIRIRSNAINEIWINKILTSNLNVLQENWMIGNYKKLAKVLFSSLECWAELGSLATVPRDPLDRTDEADPGSARPLSPAPIISIQYSLTSLAGNGIIFNCTIWTLTSLILQLSCCWSEWQILDTQRFSYWYNLLKYSFNS